MASFYISLLLFRIVLPLIIGICVIIRPCGLSAIYLAFLCYLPIVPVPTESSMAGHTGIYLKILIGVSMLTSISQITFQIVLASLLPYGHFLENCKFLEKILRHVGFVRYDTLATINVVTWVTPEILMVFASIMIYRTCSQLCASSTTSDTVEDGVRAPTKAPRRPIGFVVSAGKYMVLIAMCFAAVLRPSVIGGLYFLIFLITATWWSCCKQLRKGFAIVLRCLMVVVLGHLIVLYGYQFQWPQELLDKNSTYARYFGLTPIITVDCADDPRKFVWSVEEWATYVNPIAVFLLYYILAVESKFLLNPQSQKKQGPFSRLDGEMGRQLSQRLSNRKLGGTASTRHKWQSATRKVRMQLLNSTVVKFTESTPLIRGVSPKAKRYGSGHRKAGSGALQDSTGSVTITGENTEDIPMEQLEEEYKPTVCENIMFGLETVLHVIIKSSYIGTNIIMMAWSITYLSWITFVLLLWANLLWLVPNQRKSMLRSSPFLVFYAWFLLISAYIYSMNLTEDELPSTIQGINLAQIGFDKVTVLPCNQLMVKCVFTVMFWVTLRQYMQELRTERQNNALADMVSPLQVSVGTATTGVNNEAGNGGSEFMNKFGVHLRKFLTKFWIWVVAITLFAVAITGERMTGFRILYMALFLFFVLSFQLSFHVWRKMMFGFWLTVIVYSMIILVMVYTYQFDHFQDYWRDYFHVDLQQQLDIGLEKFETKQLFVRLVTPTFFVIIAVIQVHYFHKDFMELSDPRNASPIGRDVDESSLQGGALQDSSEKDDTITSSIKYDVTNSHTTREKRCARFLKTAQRIVNIVYVFLELHMPKFVLFFLVLVCVFDKCAIYISLAILIVLACTLGRAMQMFSIYCSSIIVSVMLLARMIYQIEYINPSNWNVTCELGNDTVIENNAKWFGFNKTSSEIGLPRLVRWNIMYILMVTIMSVVFVRQFNYRASRGKPTTRAFFMFPRITRNDADKDLLSCFKYFANYGFYKFGVEICLMVTVILIGTRIDMYAVFYGLWLCALFSLQRKTLARIWNIYLLFIAISIIIQYLMTVGFPPTLCFLFPWDKNYWGPKDVFIVDMYERLQSWAYLFDTDHPPPAKKLLCDFVLLIFVSRQSVVFRIEKRYEGQYYAGGSNESIIEHAEDKDFNNPVPDFITHVCSYVDVFKRGILMGHIWVTLAIVFLAGTNRVNIFSIGYLCCAFIFLWQGSDLYLRPIPRILKLWNGLLTYNVSVILIKTSLQIVGCVFINNIPSNSCWLIQLLGIGCVDKFEKLRRMPDIDDLECKVPREFVGLVWDGLCFGFLLAQRRIFQSYNFFHMINEIKATTILTSRGAELIEELRVIRMAEQDELERNILEKIKAKMDKIKATQQKIRGANFQDTDNHHVAIRSGDYYMFDDLDDDEDLNFIENLRKDSMKDPDEDEKPDQVTVGQFLSTALKTDIGTAVRYHSDLELKRRLSMPMSRQKSITTRSQISVPFSAPPTIEEHPKTVTIIKPTTPEPQPGTSKDEDYSELEPTKTPLPNKILNFFQFLWAFVETFMITLTNYLNKYSKDYRYVIRVLSKEKKLLKGTTDFSTGIRVGRGQVWQPAASYHSLLRQSREHASQNMDLEEYETTEMSSYDQPTIIRLLLAIWQLVLCHSELVCYFVIFLNQIKSATFLSLPLPLMVFLWGTLTIPRPNKNFWVTVIAYTEVIVLIKCCFQFDIIPWNLNPAITNNPFYPPRIIGIERTKNYAVWDLLLLLVVFFHRFMLKSMGLWKTSEISDQDQMREGVYHISPDGVLVTYEGPEHRKSMVIKSSITVSSKVILLHKKKRAISICDSNSKTSKDVLSPARRPSDLQRLVEEGEDQEVDDKKPEEGEDKILRVEMQEIEPSEDFPLAIKLASSKYADAFKIFFRQLRDPTSRIAADVYSYMFLCDFFNFFVIIFGYASFGTQQGDGGVSSYLEDNRVPVLFLLMLIMQFMLIIVDRGIFLRKNILCKIIFQFVQVFILHVWLFILFPIITERQFNSVLPPQMYYMVKCFYLLLSAYQIRCGYPTRILGNFLCKGYNYINMILFKVFMIIPFVYELRTIMDWMWTDTSMTVFDWMKMEDIFAHIFQLKCSRHCDDEYPQPRGEKKNPVVKYAMGGGILAVIIAVIWFPLVFFSLGNAVGISNPPFDVTLDIRIGPYEPVYTLTAQDNSIFPFTEGDLKTLQNVYAQHKYAATFISNYQASDIAAVKLSSDSSNIWSISPPDRQRMVDEVKSTKPITIRLEYLVSRKTSKPEDSATIRETVSITIPPGTPQSPNFNRQLLLAMLDGNTTTKPMILKQILPKFLKVTNRGKAEAITQLMFSEVTDDRSTSMRTLSLSLKNRAESTKEWWTITEDCRDVNYNVSLRKIPYVDCDAIILYTFNDKIFPSTLSIITGGGIFGMYALYFFVFFRITRTTFLSNFLRDIWLDDMPNVDRIYSLINEIYIVRTFREYALEEDLFAKLVFLLRSRELSIKLTRKFGNHYNPEFMYFTNRARR